MGNRYKKYPKALLKAMLEPIEELKEAELNFDFTKRLAFTEELKDFPYADVWNYFCEINNVPVGHGLVPRSPTI